MDLLTQTGMEILVTRNQLENIHSSWPMQLYLGSSRNRIFWSFDPQRLNILPVQKWLRKLFLFAVFSLNCQQFMPSLYLFSSMLVTRELFYLLKTIDFISALTI